MSDVLIITVNFRHAECTLQFLHSQQDLRRFANCHLVIVDNNSEDGSALSPTRGCLEIQAGRILPSSENRGYFGAASWALRAVPRGATACRTG